MGSEEDETRSPSDNVSQIVGVWMKRHEAYFISQNYYYYSGYMVEILERAWTWHWDPYDRSMLMAMALLAFLLSMMAGAYIHAATDACDCACDCEPKCDYPYPEEQDQTTTYSDYNSTDMCDCSTPESYCCTATYTHSPTSSDVSGTTSGSGDSRYR